jgi:hypothetical protein
MRGFKDTPMPATTSITPTSNILPDVVNHYDTALKLKLTEQEKNDLIEYLKFI